MLILVPRYVMEYYHLSAYSDHSNLQVSVIYCESQPTVPYLLICSRAVPTLWILVIFWITTAVGADAFQLVAVSWVHRYVHITGPAAEIPDVEKC